MTVRGGKNRVLIYAGAGLFLIALVVLYHNAATRLDDSRKLYEKCHMNEESLAAQLQVILEYKIRLEKSLQQEKSDHAQTKDDLRNKAQEEKETKDRENNELNNKYTALQQQYKLLQSQQEDAAQELEKSKRQLLEVEEEKSKVENQVSSLRQQIKLIQEGRESDNLVLKEKLSKLEAEYSKLKLQGGNSLIKEKSDLQRELAECLRSHTTPNSLRKNVLLVKEELVAPSKRSTPRSSTSRSDVAAGAVMNFRTATPVINPDALQSQDRTPSPAPLPPVVVKIPALPEFREQQERRIAHEEEPKPNQQIPQPAPQGNEIPRNQAVYNYPADYEKDDRKEEDDDDMDQIDPNEKAAEPQEQPPNVQFADKHDSVMVIPK